MSDEYEGLREDIEAIASSMARYYRAVHKYTDAADSQTRALWQDIAELRDELHAVANRLENLTRVHGKLLADGDLFRQYVRANAAGEPSEVAQAIVNDANRSTLREVRGEES